MKLQRLFIQFFFLIALIVSGGVFFRQHVHAADFDINYQNYYKVEEDGTMLITETKVLRNNSTRYFLPADSEQTFIVQTFLTRSANQKEELERVAKTIILTDASGKKLESTINITDTNIEVTVKLAQDLNYDQKQVFILKYENFQLAEKSGNVWNIYIPGLPKNFDEVETTEVGATTQKKYSIQLEVPDSFGAPQFIAPNPEVSAKQAGSTVYTFTPTDLVEQAAWLQIGNEQFYSFTIVQKVSINDTALSRGFNTWYDLVLPRDGTDGKQSVYFESITPKPYYVRNDGEGNLIARFGFAQPGEYEILVKGYIKKQASAAITQEQVGELAELSLSQTYASFDETELTLEDLVSSQAYWEVDAPEIKKKAQELMKGKGNVYDILIADYQFVTNTVDYDNLKIGINNVRQGALKTLQGGSSVCMEYSDLLITLLRAQGIPARAAFGYGFDPRDNDPLQEGHQWLEVYMPEVGWVAVDPTWGDTGRRNYIGSDLDHALWYVAGRDVQSPSSIVRYSVSDTTELSPPDISMTAVETIPGGGLTSQTELLAQYAYSPKVEFLEKFDQLNQYGKIIAIAIPTLLLIIIVLIGLSVLSKLFKNKKKEMIVSQYPREQVAPLPPRNP